MGVDETAGRYLSLAILILVLAVTLGLLTRVMGNLQANEVTTHVVINNSPVGHLNFTGFASAKTLSANPGNKTFFIQIVNSSVIISNATNTFDFATYNTSWILNPTSATIQLVAGGSISNNTNDSTNEGVLNVSYSYQIGSDARNQFGKGKTALDTIADWLDDLTLIEIAVVLITVLGSMLAIGTLIHNQGGGETQL